MQSDQKLKHLRDALWQALAETKSPAPADGIQDPYTIPLDEVAASLAGAGAISDTDAGLIIGFLDRYGEDEENQPAPVELPDDEDTEISRIVAELRSFRLRGDRDEHGLGPGGGEDKVVG